MKAQALEIRWHDTSPIFSTDFQAISPEKHRKIVHPYAHQAATSLLGSASGVTSRTDDKVELDEKLNAATTREPLWRLATAGGDRCIRLWLVHPRPLPVAAPISLVPLLKPVLKPDLGPRVEYLAKLQQHTGVVNVVRFAPVDDILASAGDDGNVVFWIPSATATSSFGDSAEDRAYEKEHWRNRNMCRVPTGKEIYDLAWSPDGVHILAGSVDHTAYIWNALTSQLVHKIAEHSHYVQGVAWDPLGRFIATQSSDRSMHVYSIEQSQTGLQSHAVGKTSRLDVNHQAGGTWNNLASSSTAAILPATAAISKSKEKEKEKEKPASLALPRPRSISHATSDSDRSESASTSTAAHVASTSTSTPSTEKAGPFGMALDREVEIIEGSNSMNPPALRPSASSRRSSISSVHSPLLPPTIMHSKHLRSPSPAPLPATHRPLSPTLGSVSLPPPLASASTSTSQLSRKSATTKAMLKLYGDASSTPFFRRLCWSTDGSLLLTPAGLFEDPYGGMVGGVVANEGGSTVAGGSGSSSSNKKKDREREKEDREKKEPKPTVYIYSRSNLARPPIAHLPGHKSTSIAIRFCPVLWELRKGVRGAEDDYEENVKRVEFTKELVDVTLSGDDDVVMSGVEKKDKGKGKGKASNVEEAEKPPASLFDLPYRMVYAVATLDAVFLYDTQQAGPICMFGNLHYAPFTDLTWSADGETLMVSSQDGYCSIVAFEPLELGTPYTGPSPLALSHHSSLLPPPSSSSSSNSQSTSSVPAPAPVPVVITHLIPKPSIQPPRLFPLPLPLPLPSPAATTTTTSLSTADIDLTGSSPVPVKRAAAAEEAAGEGGEGAPAPAPKKKRAELTRVGPLER